MDMMWYRRRGLMVTPHIERVTGAIASFNSDYNKIPVKSLICNIEPIQEGEGDPSPENVRPISGRTGLSVVMSGKNLVDDSIKYVTTTGTSLYIGFNSTKYHLYLPSGTYNFSCIFASGVHYAAYIKKENGSDMNIWNKDSELTSKSFDLETGIYRIRFYNSAEDGGVSASNVSNIMLEAGSTATDYEAYKGSTYSVNWQTEAGTVYGGTLDVVSGKLTVDRGYSKLSDLTSWGANSTLTSGTMRAVIPNVLRVASSVVTTAIMDCRKSVAYGPIQPTWTTSFAISYDGKIIIPMNRAITVAEFLSEYGNHEVCYPLATPTEIQLTPQEVRTLLGINNIWCNSGDVSVDYWKWGK